MAKTSGRLQTMPARGSVRFNSRPRAGKPMVRSGGPKFASNFSRGPGAKVVKGKTGNLTPKGRFGRSAGRVSGSFITVKKGTAKYRFSGRGGASIQGAQSAAQRHTG